jgi:O-antigen/teichoic acid export membrane protein
MSPKPRAKANKRAGKRVTLNAFWLLAGRVGSQGLLLVFSVLIARRLGNEGLGWYAFITSVVYLGNLISTFGTDMLIMRELAARRDFGVVRGSLQLQLGLSMAMIVLVLAVSGLLPSQTEDSLSALKIYSFALVPMAFYSVFSAVLRAFERMNSFAFLNLLNGLLMVMFSWTLILPGTNLTTLALMLLVIQVLCAGAAVWVALWSIPELGRNLIDAQAATRKVISAAAPIAILGILGVFYQRAPIYVLATTQGAETTGEFAAALRLVEAAKLGHFAVLGATFPVMARASMSLDSTDDSGISNSLLVLLAISLAFSLVFYFLADWLMATLFGREFLASGPVLQNLAWLLLPVTLSHYYSLRLLSVSRESTILVAICVSLMFLIAGLILSRQLVAVAHALIVAEAVQAALMFMGWRSYRMRNATP